jgi:hypothetical protein
MAEAIAPSKEVKVLLPTFIMQPSDEEKFRPSLVKAVCEGVLKDEIDSIIYNAETIDDDLLDSSTRVADKIKESVKQLNMPRYKIVVQVALGQMKDQAVRVSSRCLWSSGTDNYSSANYSNEHLWGVAIVFGCYVE